MRPCKLALGTVQFGLPYGVSNRAGQILPAEAAAILDLASARGIDLLDSAAAYGTSEEVLGGLGAGSRFRIVSKIPRLPPSDAADFIRASLDGSLQRLGLRSLDTLLLHHPGDLVHPEWPQIRAALDEAEARGATGRWGVSVYTAADIDLALEHGAARVIQLPASAWDQRLLRSGHVARLEQAGCEIHVRSLFLQGLLLMPTAELATYFAPWKDHHARFHAWAGNLGCSPLALCLAFGKSVGHFSRLVLGVTSCRELAEILAAWETAPDLGPDDFAEWAVDDPAILNPALWKLT
ncbi:MAG: hypothetical protein RL095_380 [Verrucomicrobiota bacterium]|jgi:aryl-alcohol dehydrogenase-like predicted oxidoreductase